MLSHLPDRIASMILERSWFRSDRIWTKSLFYGKPLNNVSFHMDRWALARSQYWGRDQLDALTERRLNKLFAAVAEIPFWKETFQKHPRGTLSAREYLATLPVISRSTFKEISPDTYVSYRHLEGSIRETTSGSTGIPFTFFLDRGALLSTRAVRDRDYCNAAGGRYPMILLRADQGIQTRFHTSYFVYLRSLADIPDRFEALAECFEQNAPRGGILYTFPSMAIALAQYMEQNKKTLPVKAVIGSGESVSPENRAMLERVFKARFMLQYGSLETSGIACECEEGRRHVNEEDIYLEIVDGSGNVVPEGTEGKIVMTMLGYRGMPLIRYSIGDLGTLSSEPCACGRSYHSLALVGRTPALLEQKDGYTVTLTELTNQLNFRPGAIKAYQIVHHAPDKISIHIVPGEEYGEFRENIEGAVIRKLHPETKVEFVLESDIPPSPSGKARYYIKKF